MTDMIQLHSFSIYIETWKTKPYGQPTYKLPHQSRFKSPPYHSPRALPPLDCQNCQSLLDSPAQIPRSSARIGNTSPRPWRCRRSCRWVRPVQARPMGLGPAPELHQCSGWCRGGRRRGVHGLQCSNLQIHGMRKWAKLRGGGTG